MAAFSGVRCDGPNCKTMVEGTAEPEGWIVVRPILARADRGESGTGPERGNPGNAALPIVCSNKCLASLGRERAKTLDGVNYGGRAKADT